ncbi:hypothetical protein CC86DRAFT_16255 [Ophiobolus disseminans]|uniref:Zn(2)-C6 fungal-type domain-containing protein n=1 Tax=Ophiobolus disseminans TaxID=1469910 RepID=A0A6A7AKV2_9PLEO|nr:hypothetical protein CC86DRAFT_16255 [Ophiobolus disseminans]
MTPEPNFQVLTLVSGAPSLYARPYRSRRAHKKTATGCLTCRAKRVKCDEIRPVCAKCRRNSRSCSYSIKVCSPEQADKLAIASPLADPLGAVTLSTNPTWDCLGNGTPTIHLLQHCLAHWNEIFHLPRDQRLLSMSAANPLVERTFLAVTACHLRHVSPGALQHRIADHYQQSLVLSHLRKLLTTPQEKLVQSDSDAVMLCATLLNVITFALPDSQSATANDPKSSWVFETHDECLGWLDLQIGLRPLLLSMSTYFDATIDFLGPIFFGPDRATWEFKKMAQAVDLIPQTWIDFFGFQDLTTQREGSCDQVGNVFRAPVLILAQLRNAEARPGNVYKSIQFLMKFHKECRALLRERDDRAMWLFGYWLGLLCRFEKIWWCKKRARRDYAAICMWLRERPLSQRPGDEGRAWQKMMAELEDLSPSSPNSLTCC